MTPLESLLCYVLFIAIVAFLIIRRGLEKHLRVRILVGLVFAGPAVAIASLFFGTGPAWGMLVSMIVPLLAIGGALGIVAALVWHLVLEYAQ